MKQNRKSLSAASVIMAACLWGAMGILVRTLNSCGLNAMEVVAFRAFVTAGCMLLGMICFQRKQLKIKIKDLWCFVGTGILSVVFFNVCYFSCMNETTLSVAAILLYTAPSFVILMSFVLFRERLTRKKLISLVLAFIGCVLVSGGFHQAEGIGIAGLLTGLGAGFGYALYSIFSRFAIQRGYSSLTITTYTFFFAAAGCVPFVPLEHMVECVSSNIYTALFGVIMTFLTTVLAYILYTKGLEGMENGRASILASIEPVVATIVGSLIYKEELQIAAVFGMLMVLASCILLGQEK